MKEQQNNIKYVSFQNEQSKIKRRRRNRRNKKYFFKRKNLRRKGERGNSSEDQNKIAKEFF
jgi:hypothetical protein